MNTTLVTIIAAAITGSLVTFTGAALRLHSRFILLEVSVKNLRVGMRRMDRKIDLLMPVGITSSLRPGDSEDGLDDDAL